MGRTFSDLDASKNSFSLNMVHKESRQKTLVLSTWG